MDRSRVPAAIVGNEFYVPPARERAPVQQPARRAVADATPRPIHERAGARPTPITVDTPEPIVQSVAVTTPLAAPTLAQAMTLRPVFPALSLKPLADTFNSGFSRRALEAVHAHSVIAFSLLILLVGSTGTTVYGNYRAASIESQVKPSLLNQAKAPSITGLNSTVPAAQLNAQIQAVTSQAITLNVGDRSEKISPDTIKNWLQVTTDAHKNAHIHVDSAAITKTVSDLAKSYEKAPVDQISSTVTGSTQVIATGKTGLHLSNPDSIVQQTPQLAKTLLDAKGYSFSTPVETVPFQSVTPTAYSKMIEINVNTKQMYLYDNGQVTHTYPISAGAPETPTPIGQYHIFSKLATQDMSGYNPNGTKYFQPHVRWINYFLPGGYAIHGNYWRPTSWFGNINSSHGCASLPDAQAKEVYDWAPMGTLVVTHQ